eukprot:3906142-Prymnesium_polylepis.1
MAAPGLAQADIFGRTGHEPELLAGLKEDFEIEQRHKAYPMTVAFVDLLHKLVSVSAATGAPAPVGIGRYMQWVAEGLFCGLQTIEFRDGSHKWAFAAACLRLLLRVVGAYDPDDSEPVKAAEAPPAGPTTALQRPPPPPPEPTAGFQLLCAFVKPHSRLYQQLVWLLIHTSAA